MNGYHQHWGQNPHQQFEPYHQQQSYHNPQSQELKHHTLMTVKPFVDYGLKEAKYTSHAHALLEVAAISYLIGRGYHPNEAHQIVESWEVNESF